MQRELISAVALNDASHGIKTETRAELTPGPSLQGSLLVLMQFDVCEEIRLDGLREIFGARTVEATFKNAAPSYVRYQRPPVVEALEPLVLETGERLDGQIKYYDYGVLSLIFELPFCGDWNTLVKLGGRWFGTPTLNGKLQGLPARSWNAPRLHWLTRIRIGLAKTTSFSTSARLRARPRLPIS